MHVKALAFPFVLLAATAGTFHACQPTGPAAAGKTGTPAGAGSAGNCGITVLYQNNGDGEIEPCG